MGFHCIKSGSLPFDLFQTMEIDRKIFKKFHLQAWLSCLKFAWNLV